MRAKPADPKQCRENALLCTELAEKADALARANRFRNLAKRICIARRVRTEAKEAEGRLSWRPLSFQNNCEMSPFGAKRTYRDDVQFVRFWGKADMHDRLASASRVAIDPQQT